MDKEILPIRVEYIHNISIILSLCQELDVKYPKRIWIYFHDNILTYYENIYLLIEDLSVLYEEEFISILDKIERSGNYIHFPEYIHHNGKDICLHNIKFITVSFFKPTYHYKAKKIVSSFYPNVLAHLISTYLPTEHNFHISMCSETLKEIDYKRCDFSNKHIKV